MRADQHFTVTLPGDMADALRAKIASGEYADDRAKEFVRDLAPH